MTARRGPKRLAAGELDELVRPLPAGVRPPRPGPHRLRRPRPPRPAHPGRGRGQRRHLRRPRPHRARRCSGSSPRRSRRRCGRRGASSLVAAACLFVPAIAIGAWLPGSSEALDVAIPDRTRRRCSSRSSRTTTRRRRPSSSRRSCSPNNIQVSLVAFALGSLLCVPGHRHPRLQRRERRGGGAVFVAAGEPGKFFGLIAPTASSS